MSYNVKVYRRQGGDGLIVASGGSLTLESGSSFTIATPIEMQSGASLSIASGAYTQFPVQTLTSTQTATNATNFGLTVLTGTTTGPTYTLAAPVAGVSKTFSMTSSSSGATHRAVLRSNSTGVSFDTTGGNQVTFATSALRGLSLVAETTARWRIVGVYTGASIAAPRTT